MPSKKKKTITTPKIPNINTSPINEGEERKYFLYMSRNFPNSIDVVYDSKHRAISIGDNEDDGKLYESIQALEDDALENFQEDFAAPGQITIFEVKIRNICTTVPKLTWDDKFENLKKGLPLPPPIVVPKKLAKKKIKKVVVTPIKPTKPIDDLVGARDFDKDD